MHALNLAAPVVVLLLQGVAAVPAPELVARADVLAPTAAWISVNDKGVPTTVTPVPTTISGTPTFASAAPNALTGSVFTLTDFRLVQVTTSTGSPPLATADSKSGAGAFAPCSNANGDFSPFCDPAKDSKLFVDGTYYVTWDPTVLIKGNKTNVHVKIQGKAVNGTTVGDIVVNDDTDKTNPAAWGYYAWNVDGSLIPSGQDNATIELLMSYTIDNIAQQDITGPRVLVIKRPQFHPQPTKLPKGAELYIALPTVFGFIVLAVIGGCLWNRSTRKIGLGNVMSRSRHGYGIGKARAQRLGARVRQSVFHGRKDRGIQLREREMDLGGDGYVYRDEPLPGQRPAGRPRRDSDSLGSLADSPISTHFQDQDVRGAGGGGNAFREELRRQERERF